MKFMCPHRKKEREGRKGGRKEGRKRGREGRREKEKGMKEDKERERKEEGSKDLIYHGMPSNKCRRHVDLENLSYFNYQRDSELHRQSELDAKTTCKSLIRNRICT